MEPVIRAAVQGAVVGATLGAPLKGGPGFRKLNFYEPIPTRMAPSEALDSWVVSAKHVGAGRPAELIPLSMRSHWTYSTHETAFGQANLQAGLYAPIAGSFRNPLANGSNAIGRAPAWGLLFHGDPDAAAEHAYFDASIDHSSDGVWCAVAVATMVASAAPGTSSTDLVRQALGLLPKGSRAHQAIALCLQQQNKGAEPSAAAPLLPHAVGTQDSRNAALTFGYLILSLLCAQGDFSLAVRTAAGCGGAAEQSALAAGAIAALQAGTVPGEWLDPLGSAYVAGHGLRDIQVPATIEEFASLVVDESQPVRSGLSLDADQPSLFGQPTIEAAPTAGNPPETPEATQGSEAKPRDPWVPGERIRSLLQSTPNCSHLKIGDLRIGIQYVDPPSAAPSKTNRLVIGFENVGASEIATEPALSALEGWVAASKLTSFRLRAGESSDFACVVQAPAGLAEPIPRLNLKVDRNDLEAPLFRTQLWYVCGPFVNHEGGGFDKAFRCEDVLNPDEVFNGRSDLPVSWVPTSFPGIVFDIEPLFKTGPGVVYLFARVRWGRAGQLRLVVASSPGVVASIDRQRLVRYHDTHEVVPRAVQPYVAEFTANETSDLLIKLTRNLEPIGPASIYFLDEAGALVEPAEFLPMV